MPVLAPLDAEIDRKQFTNDLVPEPTVMPDWWGSASVAQKRESVGQGRFNLMKGLVDNPRWEHFIDPVSGEVLSAEQLKSETGQQRHERVSRVAAILGINRDEIAQISKFASAV